MLRAASLLVALSVLAAGPATAGLRNAESSGDAPADPARAVELAGAGAYYGRLTTASDVDTFRESSGLGDPGCVVLKSYASTWVEATLSTVGSAASHSVDTPIPPWSGASPRVALAVEGASVAQLAFAAIPDPETGAAAAGGFYGFELGLLDRASLGPGDGASGTDAGASLGEAVPAGGVCIGGTLSGILDIGDVYAFNLTGPQQIVYSLAATPSSSIRIEILDAMGQRAAMPALDGEIGTIVLPEAGTYYASVSMSGTSVVEYVLALVGPDPPPGSPCRPTCHVS